MEKVKAISLWEPWASLIRTGAKTWETRSWATQHRGPLLICAAKGGLSKDELIKILGKYDFQKGLGFNVDRHLWRPSFIAGCLNFGKAVAIVEVKYCEATSGMDAKEIGNDLPFGDFSPGRYAWKLKMINNTFQPFPVKGRQGFFDVELPEGIKL